MIDVRHFQRVEEEETTSRPFYWESKDHILFSEVDIDVSVERGDFSGEKKWVVKVEKVKHSDGWSSDEIVATYACRDKARDAAIDWMHALVDKLVVDVSDVNDLVDDGWQIIWQHSGNDANPNHKTIELKRGFIQKKLFMTDDDYQVLQE